MELTQKHLDAIINISVKVDDLVDEVHAMHVTQDAHTAALDAITKNTKNWDIEMQVMKARLDRYDRWFEDIGGKLNMKFER